MNKKFAIAISTIGVLALLSAKAFKYEEDEKECCHCCACCKKCKCRAIKAAVLSKYHSLKEKLEIEKFLKHQE